MSHYPDDHGYHVLREMSQQKRKHNRESSAEILTNNCVQYDVRNSGAHLIVRHGNLVVDFWPGTGRWIVRGDEVKGFGVFKLLHHLGVRV